MLVITEMLGIPSSEKHLFRNWSNQVIEAAGKPEHFRTIQDDLLAFNTYLQQLLKSKRARPTKDLLSKLIEAEAEGKRLSEKELLSMVFLLLIAGHETTVSLISNGILALIQHPDQLHLLRQKPELMKSAIEELLRYQGPLMTATARWIGEDLVFDGQEMKRGQQVLVVLASANRDESAFKDADTLNITRQENHHLAFGKGIHYCLGAPLARLEGQIAIQALLQRLPDLQLAIDPALLTWRPGFLIMGLTKLPIKI
jgi:cytochrome P450